MVETYKSRWKCLILTVLVRTPPPPPFAPFTGAQFANQEPSTHSTMSTTDIAVRLDSQPSTALKDPKAAAGWPSTSFDEDDDDARLEALGYHREVGIHSGSH